MVLRSSLLKQALLNPDLCWSMIHGGYNLETTPAMAFGTLSHLAILQPDLFRNSFALKEHRKGKEFDVNDNGQFLILPNTYQKLVDMQAAFNRKINVKSLIAGQIESEWFATIDGHECVAHPDVVNGDILIDYKTLSNVKKNWAYVAADGGYDVQFAHYHKVLSANGVNIRKWYHIVQMTTFPYTVILYKYTKDYMQHALQAHSEALERYNILLNDEFALNKAEEEYVHLNNRDKNDDDTNENDNLYREARALWA